MLSIDEAIAKYNKLANNDRTCYPEEAQQLAEWLEELKAIKDGGKAIRNEAIDDFIHECDKYCGFYSGKNKSITREDILKIAEQLKAKNNERRSDGE